MLKLLTRSVVVLAILAGGLAYAAVGFYQVAPDEEAVVLRLGRYDRTRGEGFHWHAFGLETVEKRQVTVTQEEEFGFRTVQRGPPPTYEDRPIERRMLSGDANIIDVEFVVQYRIVDLAAYLFGVPDPSAVIRDAAQAVMRAEVGKRPVEDVMTGQRALVEVEARDRLQATLDAYGVGVRIQNVQLQDVAVPDEVKEAFADVASAEQDRERMILDAQGYAQQVVPRARGEAQEMLNQARAYRAMRTEVARGEADRFTTLLTEYRKAPQVTRQRLYIETLEAIMPSMEKVIIEEGHADKVLPYLPLTRRRVQP